MSKITPLTVLGIVNSNPKSFRSLYDAFYSYLCGIAVSYVHDFEVARELVNDVFIRVWEHRTRLKYPPLPYLISGVRNACLNYLRDRQNTSEAHMVFMESLPDVPVYNEADVEEIVAMIDNLRSSLPPRCAEIFALHYNQGLDTEEIAGRLGVSQSTVRVQIKIALDKIREKIRSGF